jgi:hypothetical protein
MPLPTKAIDRLFERLMLTYGNEWTMKFEGIDMNGVKSMWAHELSSFADNLKILGWALENLPAKCPNVIEFKNLCRQAPKPDTKMLDVDKAPTHIVDAQIAEMVRVVTEQTNPNDSKRDYKAWAKKLKARHDAGEKLEIFQVRSYKVALGITEKY